MPHVVLHTFSPLWISNWHFKIYTKIDPSLTLIFKVKCCPHFIERYFQTPSFSNYKPEVPIPPPFFHHSLQVMHYLVLPILTPK